jgi:hypothetical protein
LRERKCLENKKSKYFSNPLFLVVVDRKLLNYDSSKDKSRRIMANVLFFVVFYSSNNNNNKDENNDFL